MIRAESVQYQVGDFALDVSVEVEHAQYFVLLGATGSGKTLFLECLCGLRRVRSGRIEVNGHDLTDADPAERNVGYVPQDGALFGHLDVRGNIGFSLKVRGVPAPEREKKVRRLAEMLHIAPLLGRPIQGLSGGERQRVALARALACEPALLLLDEPVSALDEFTRDAVCRELVKLPAETGVSVVHVCHSFDEAQMVGDRIGVIEHGNVVQTGTADELMSRPASRYIANIMRLENVFAGRASPVPGGSRIEGDGFSIIGPAAEGDVEFLVRPWDIRVASAGDADGNVTEGTVSEFSMAGPLARLRIDGALPLVLLVPREHAASEGLAKGRAIRVAFGRNAVHVFDARP